MLCEHCNRAKADHVHRNGRLWCIVVTGRFTPKITNLSARITYTDEEGNPQERDATLSHLSRKLASLDNILTELLRKGCTKITIEITNS